MATNTTATTANLGDQIATGITGALGAGAKTVKAFIKAESEKLAITLRMIVEGIANGELTKADAKALLNQQKVAAASVLTAAQGMALAAAQAAINAGLKVIKDFINGKLGFALL